jgi:acyl CoA:acetate/3-ketoacid CoA transferase beta subunit
MTVTAARQLQDAAVCFVGIGLPSAACNLARLSHAPNLVLIYESGTVGVKPNVLPLSIGDGELAETATCIVPLPEIFAHYLQRGRVDVGFLGAAQIDRHGNLNSTVIGDYAHPGVRLPGGGGAPEIATYARDVLIIMKQSPRSFVARLDFRTSCGYLAGGGERAASGCPGGGPRPLCPPSSRRCASSRRARARRIPFQSASRSRTREPRNRHAPTSHPHATPGPQGAGAHRARPLGHYPVLPTRLPVRHGARARCRGLGRRWEPLPRLHERHRRRQHRARAPAGGRGDQGRGG